LGNGDDVSHCFSLHDFSLHFSLLRTARTNDRPASRQPTLIFLGHWIFAVRTQSSISVEHASRGDAVDDLDSHSCNAESDHAYSRRSVRPQRCKLSDAADGTCGLQPERAGRVRCSAWLDPQNLVHRLPFC
jgi:hypothetical protein